MGGGASKSKVQTLGGKAGAKEVERLREQVNELREKVKMYESGAVEQKSGLSEASMEKDSVMRAASYVSEHWDAQKRAKRLHDQHAHHEQLLKAKVDAQMKKKRESLGSRLAARIKLKQTKVLQKAPIFASLEDSVISEIVDKMEFQQFGPGEVLCNQGDPADIFYVIIQGECHVLVQQEIDGTEPTKIGNSEEADAAVQVGLLHELDFFGESALFDAAGADGRSAPVQKAAQRLRTATVKAGLEKVVKVLGLHKDIFDTFVQQGKIDGKAVFKVRTTAMERQKMNKAKGLNVNVSFMYDSPPKPFELKPCNEAQEKNTHRDLIVALQKAESARDIAQSSEVAALQKFYAAKSKIKALEDEIKTLKASNESEYTITQSGLSDVTMSSAEKMSLRVSKHMSAAKVSQDEARKARLAKLEEMKAKAATRTGLSSNIILDKKRRDSDEERLHRRIEDPKRAALLK